MRYRPQRQGSAKEGQREVRLVLPEVAAVQSLSQRAYSLSFVAVGKQHSATCTRYGAESCVCPLGILQFLDFLPGALLRSVCYATKLADNRKELHIKNPQKTRQRSFPSLT